MNSFYSFEELVKIGLKHFGKNVKISRYSRIYSPENVIIGDNVRIDDFCILSGKIIIGNYVHISASSLLFAGSEGIIIKDFVSISSRCSIYAISDDYSGDYLINPMIDEHYRNVVSKKIIIEKHVVIGSGSTILPGAILSEGCAFGAMSLIKYFYEPWTIYAGIPCKKLKERSQKIKQLEIDFINNSAL